MGTKHGLLLTRRQALKSVGLGVGTGLVTSVVTPGSAQAGQLPTWGYINRLLTSSSLSLATVDGAVLVEFTDRAKFWRDELTTLDAFTRGDQVIVGGRRNDQTFRAHSMQSYMRWVEATITDRTVDHLETDVGPVLLTSLTKTRRRWPVGITRRRPADLIRGDRLVTVCRLSNTWQEYVAYWTAVRDVSEAA